MAATENKGPAILVNEDGDSVKSAHKMGDDPIPSNHFSSGQGLNLGIINQFGQLMGEYSRLDDELWLSKSQDDEAVERSNEGLQWDLLPSCKNTVDLGQLSDCVDNSICGGTTSVRGNSSLRDTPQNQSQIASPVSVLPGRKSDSDVRTRMHPQSQHHQPMKHNFPGGLQTLGTTISAREHSRAFQSESEYSMESSVLDHDSEDSTSAKEVRTRKISDLLDLGSERAAKKCLHCGTTETPQWRTGPMGRKTLCNACGVQYKHGRLFPDYRPLRSPTFDPSLHTNLPKKVQMRMFKTSEICPTPTPKPKIVERNPAFDPSLRSNLDKKVRDMVMGMTTPKPKEVERTPAFQSSLLTNLDKNVQEMIMGETSERCSTPTPKPKEVVERTSDFDPSLNSLWAATLAMRMGKTSERPQNITSQFEGDEKMSLGSNKKNDQNRAQRAKKFQEMREKESNLFQPEFRETNQKFDSILNRKRKLASKAGKACQHCESTKTPQWREGPMGRHTLCNACGVQYRNGRLFPEYRPLKSPTYDPSLHSHLPKKVLEMRLSKSEKCATSGSCE